MFASDGYIRLTYSDFCALPMRSHLAWQDGALLNELREQGVPAETAGYCEWVSRLPNVPVSIGWAWFISESGADMGLAPGGLSCNLMLCNEHGSDLGAHATEELLTRWLASTPWKNIARRLH